MTLGEALKCLGATRVIWIDDHFNETPASLAKMMLTNAEVAGECGVEVLAPALALVDVDQAEAFVVAEEALSELPRERLPEIRDRFLRTESERGQTPFLEMSVDTVAQTCRMLAIADGDRWSFDGVEAKVRGVRERGDGQVAYIVDLREGRGPAGDGFRGLEVLKVLARMNSEATAFILTHEATAEREAEQEGILHERLSGEDAIDIPLCVISKQRLKGESPATEAMAEALRVAIKRAGLRRSVHEVLRRAREEVVASCAAAADGLLRVSPEHLDEHVVEVSYREGLSELHVIERALTAQIAQGLRRMFGNDDAVRRSSDRLRHLRAIPLELKTSDLDASLAAFHKAEVWEEADLLNAGHAPIACGEVFETDDGEKATAGGARKAFVLLAQPCDIAIRPNGKRAVETGVLVPIRPSDRPGKQSTEKDYKLPFQMDGQILFCHLREAVPARLSLLDLASYRTDGRVRVDLDAKPADGYLPGLTRAFEARTKPFLALMKAVAAAPDGAGAETAVLRAHEDLQLLLAAPDTFKHVKRGVYEPASRTRADGVTTERPARVTWRLRRTGRIRMPYASDLLDRYVHSVNRAAFDVDYAARGKDATEPANGTTPEGTVVAPVPASA